MHNRRKHQYSDKQAGQQAGFTLIELMIVVAVIAIIASIAIPSYNNSVLKSKRNIGKGELMEVLSRQEQHFINNKAYTLDLEDLGYTESPYHIDSQGDDQGTATAGAIYEIGFEAGSTATEFTLQATPKNGQTADNDCGTLNLSNTGLKSATGTSGAACW